MRLTKITRNIKSKVSLRTCRAHTSVHTLRDSLLKPTTPHATQETQPMYKWSFSSEVGASKNLGEPLPQHSSTVTVLLSSHALISSRSYRYGHRCCSPHVSSLQQSSPWPRIISIHATLSRQHAWFTKNIQPANKPPSAKLLPDTGSSAINCIHTCDVFSIPRVTRKPFSQLTNHHQLLHSWPLEPSRAITTAAAVLACA